MKIDVLSIGSFPEATNAELANRFAVTHRPQRPAPDALSRSSARTGGSVETRRATSTGDTGLCR